MMVVAAAGAPSFVFALCTLLPLLELVPYVNGFSFGQLNRSSNTNSYHKNSCCALKGRFSTSSTAPAAADRSFVLRGILDEVNSDAFNLLSLSKTSSSGASSNNGDDSKFEVFLAELVFSPNDPRMDIVERYDQAASPEFLNWLDSRIKNTRDVEEKVALKDLYDMILDVQQKIQISELAEQRMKAEQEAQEQQDQALFDQQPNPDVLTNAEVLRKAAQLGGSTAASSTASEEQKETKKTFLEEEHVSPEIKMSYSKLIQELLPPYNPATSLEQLVKDKYDQCDAQLLKILVEMNTEESQAVLNTIALEQQKRIAKATEKLKTILAAREPMRMEGVIVKMAREGGIDEPLLLLLEANAYQADAAGASGPAQLMRRLRSRAMEEKDKLAKSKEIGLLRKLLRTNDSTKREKILEDAFTPREHFLVAGTSDNAMKAMEGEIPEQEKAKPDVPPPDFINACKAVMINFGNLGTEESGDLLSQIRQIASEAEVVATRIYGKGMTPREQQDRAWKEKTTSIFDLEAMEIEAERMGETAPWTNPDMDDMLPGFGTDGRKSIGGR